MKPFTVSYLAYRVDDEVIVYEEGKFGILKLLIVDSPVSRAIIYYENDIVRNINLHNLIYYDYEIK